MDLTQNKLSKSEWESIEKKVSEPEEKILKLIVDGYDNVNIRYNETQSLTSYIQFDSNIEMDYFLFKRYFEQMMMSVITKYAGDNEVFSKYECKLSRGKIKKMKSGENIRLTNLENKIELNMT